MVEWRECGFDGLIDLAIHDRHNCQLTVGQGLRNECRGIR